MRMRLQILILMLTAAMCANAQNQSVQTYFGKNRMQFQEFDWSYLRGENYDIYFSKGGREIATFAARQAEQIIKSTEEFMNYRVEGRYQFIIYNNATDANQTNLGLDIEQYNTGGLTRLTGNKVVVHFTGSRSDFLKELKVGLAKVLVNDMLYGGNLQERVQNSTLIFVPEWYLNGFFTYIREGWTPELDNSLRELVMSGRYKRFTGMLEDHPVLAPAAFWYFISETSGSTALSNIIYLTRVNRDFETAIQYVLGKSVKMLSKEILPYFKKRYEETDLEKLLPKSGQLALKGFSKDEKIDRIQVSPDGQSMIYVRHHDGLSTVYLLDFKSNKRRKLYRTGLKYFFQADYGRYPVIAWHPSGRSVHYFTEKKGEINFGNIRLNRDEKNPKTLNIEQEEFVVSRLEAVFDMKFSRDGANLVLSGSRAGSRDIYLYNLNARRVTNITQDPYDDYEPAFLEEGKSRRIVFASNRPVDTLINYLSGQGDTLQMQSSTDLFVYNLGKKDKRVWRLTKTPWVNERSLLALNTGKFTYTSDVSGIINRWEGSIDSVYVGMQDSTALFQDVANVKPVTDYARNISMFSYSQRENAIYEVIATGRKPVVFKQQLLPDSLSKRIINSKPTAFRLKLEEDARQKELEDLQRQKSYLQSLNPDSVFTDTVLSQKKTPRYYFQVPGRDYLQMVKPAAPTELVESDSQPDSANAVAATLGKPSDIKDNFQLFKTRIYSPSFSLDYFVNQVGNSLFQNNIPTFVISNANQLNSNIGLILMGGTSDLFEDIKLSAGGRLSFDLSNNQYYLMAEFLRKRWDKKLVFFQNRFLRQDNRNVIRTDNIELMGSLSYPFNRHASARFHGIYRRDRYDLTATDVLRLPARPEFSQWLGVRAEYVFDNTRQVQLNILYGSRYKFFIEAYTSLEQAKNNMVVAGLDYRSYTKIYKQFIWANRIVGNFSFGSNSMLYYLGGVDNWIIPQFNNDLSAPSTQEFAFTALATNMRGFQQNARNGSNYLLINSELRLPIFSVLSRTPVSSDFFRNFQLVAFGDIGTAWSGFDPFSNQNPFNIRQFVNGPVKVTVFSNRNPILVGYGLGLRSRLFGYFIRFDYAWGIDDDQILKPIPYFSLSLDF